MQPFHKNEKLTAGSRTKSLVVSVPIFRSPAVYILHVYGHNFYGRKMTVVVLGYIGRVQSWTILIPLPCGRAELELPDANPPSIIEVLIGDISTDKQVALNTCGPQRRQGFGISARLRIRVRYSILLITSCKRGCYQLAHTQGSSRVSAQIQRQL